MSLLTNEKQRKNLLILLKIDNENIFYSRIRPENNIKL